MTEVINKVTNYSSATLRCFLCNRLFADGEELWPMFENRLLYNGQTDSPLSTILSSALGKELEQNSVHSRLLCVDCSFLLMEYETTEKKFYQLRLKILTEYNCTANQNGLDVIWYEVAEDSNGQAIATESVIENFRVVKDECEIEADDEVEETVVQQMLKSENHDNFNFVIEEIPEEYQETIVQEDEVEDMTDDVSRHGIKRERAPNEPPDEYVQIMKEEISSEQTIEHDFVIDCENSADATESVIECQSTNEDSISQHIIDIEEEQMEPEETNLSPGRGGSYPSTEFEFTGLMYVCSLCPDRSEHEPMAFPKHLKNFHNYRYYVCALCNKGFNKRTEISKHMSEDHALSNVTENGEYQCEVCSLVFPNQQLYALHKRNHYSSKKHYECSECHKRYSSKNLLDEHMNMHTGNRPHKCTLCTKGFASKYTLQAHMKIHTKRLRPYGCDECDKTFLNFQNLSQHKKLHLGIKAFVCNICQKAFGTQHNLDVHKVVHSGSKPFICRTCGKGFARRSEIRDHERIHTGERPFKCEICSMAFAQRSNLMTHKKARHLNDKKHKCELCERSFKRRRLLEYHIKSAHTGERPHKCDICNATFVYPEHFKKHLRIHSGVKPYACEVCGKLFNSRDNRNAHRFIHSEKKPYECLECGMGFMRKPLLLAHMRNTKHVNDTIIVNQPHIVPKEAEVITEFADEVISLENHNSGECEVEEEETSYAEIVASDSILVESGDELYIKNEDGKEKYFSDGPFTWVDIEEEQVGEE